MRARPSARSSTCRTAPDRDLVRQRLEQARTALGPRVQELRDADEWQRWANASVQEQLIGKAEALRAVEDPADAARQLRDLQEEWKKVAAGPRDQGQVLWRRFKTAIDEVRGRTDAFFETQAQARAKTCSGSWRSASVRRRSRNRATGLRPQMPSRHSRPSGRRSAPGRARTNRRRGSASARRAIGSSRGVTRTSPQRKHAWADNLAKKEALCARAETLAESSDWEACGRRAETAAGRVEDDRAGTEEQVGGGLAPVPRRVRSRSSSATSSVTSSI